MNELKGLKGQMIAGQTWKEIPGRFAPRVATDWRNVIFDGQTIERVGKIRWYGSATIRLVFLVAGVGLVQISIVDQAPALQPILKRISKRIPASRNMSGDPYAIRWLKPAAFIAVGTRTGKKVHLGLAGGSTSLCGVWGIQKLSDDLNLINCEKCRENNPGIFA